MMDYGTPERYASWLILSYAKYEATQKASTHEHVKARAATTTAELEILRNVRDKLNKPHERTNAEHAWTTWLHTVTSIYRHWYGVECWTDPEAVTRRREALDTREAHPAVIAWRQNVAAEKRAA